MKTVITALALMAGASASAAELPSVEHFMRHATYSSARISPTGEYLALGVDRGGQDVLTVIRLKDMKLLKVNVLPDEKSVAGYQWIGDDRLIFTAIRKFGSFAQPFGTGEWYAVNADGSQPRPVIFYGSRGTAERAKAVFNERFSLVDPLENDPRNVLMSATSPRSRTGSNTELVMVDTVSGVRKTLATAPRENCSLAVDEKKQPRFALCFDQENEQGEYDTRTELYRLGDDGKWTLVNNADIGDGKQIRVAWTAKDGTIYALQDDGKKPAAFGTLDRQTGTFQKIFQDEVSDISRYVVSPTDDKPLAVVTEAGIPRIELIDEAHADSELYASLAGAFPGQVVNFSTATRDGSKVVVSVYSDRNPGELYLFDRDTGKARFLMKAREWVNPENSASVRPFDFVNRDGMRIYGYLTIPKGSDGKNLPLIVNPHGGPMGPRDNWLYNPETQLFASRGYATLQVNFRGSGGFGKAFQDMAYGQWHTGIMNDIIDATRWAVDEGVADPDRMCIYGGSFGGYSAMMAPAREPDLYACAFGYVGAYDGEVQMSLSDTSRSESGRAYMRRAFGATKSERAEAMPVTYASKIDIPVFLAAGARDPRCPPENTEVMFKALERAGNKPEGMIIQSGEMHGFYDVDNRVNLYTQMLEFFNRHIGDEAASERTAAN
ncbi:peptidase S9 [Arenimonas soli]|uniref:Peptidase S9 n=1 Tax=Arenimonas soli TaxID=2269504 RepID=A0ABQ1HBR1_9GAMM|nr:prolyl oligopeptidase family serine peptidase [Arenimonas soli]GGA68313.1 peptidase S9 [Arenimonas soli]